MYDADKLYPTNYAQKTMVMERKLLSDPLAYNLYSLFKLVGKVDKEKFYRSFAAVVARQSALRTYFVEQDGEIYQKIAPQVEYETPVYKVNTVEELYNLKKSLNTPFDLEKAPLFKTALIELNDETYFFINFHHSIADGTSTGIFFQEILDIYSDK